MKKSFEGISVIIPSFNRVKFLYSTLLCILNQKDCPCDYEVIVIDSGNDETQILVQSFQKVFPNKIKYKKIKKCKNRSLLRNVGAKDASYNILCFLDNDILTPPNFIKLHYNEHQSEDSLVLMGARKSLTDFDIEKLGEHTLKENFNILDDLPWYNDERLDQNIGIQPWRFVFSHTLSMRKSDFEKVRGFDKYFGENWGYEDLELGFKLMNQGCKFKLLKDSFTYHQPHFEQSKKEQNHGNANGELFLKLHNCFEVELYQCFYNTFDKFLPLLSNIKQEFKIPTKAKQRKYDLIFGCLFSADENQKSNKMFLGSFCIKKDKSVKTILILNTWFDFPEIVQMSILSEAFRIGRKVYFENIGDEQKQYLFSVLRKAGISGTCIEKNGKTAFSKTEQKNTNIYIVTLPSVLQPEKRYVYVWLGRYLQRKGCYVNFNDTKNTRLMENEDFSLKENDREEITKNFDVSFGKTTCNFITSLSVMLTETNFGLPNTATNFVFHDLDFSLKSPVLKIGKFNLCRHLDESVYSLLSFCSVFEECQTVPVEARKNSFLIFMESGYLEDGIDVVLESFYEYVKTQNDATLTIKMPDFSEQLKTAHPMHNKMSKQAKFLGFTRKVEIETSKLFKKIETLNLSTRVSVLCKNLDIAQITELIANHEAIILSSRTTFVPPQIYIGFLLDKNVIIAKHHLIYEDFKQYASIVASSEEPFYKDFDLPTSSFNINYFSNTVNKEELLNALYNESPKIPNAMKVNGLNFGLNLLNKVFLQDL